MADPRRASIGLITRAGLLALVGALSLVGCRRAGEVGAPSAPQSPPARATPVAADLPSCRDRWGDSGVGDYSYGRDAQPGSRGNLGYRDYAARSGRSRCRKAWTVLIYMAADNEDLPLHAYWNLDDIETTAGAASTPDHDVVVHLDLDSPSGLRRLHLFRDPDGEPARSAADFEGATPARIRSPVVELSADERPAPATQLEDFVRWGMERYPAEHTAIVVWGHGQGWRAAGPRASPVRYEEREGGFVGGIAFDHSQGEVLDIPALADALRRAAPRPIDLLLLDACLMQSLEVAAALDQRAAYIGAYAGIAPYPGLPYRTLLPRLDRDRAGDEERCEPGPAGRPCRFAASIPGLYAAAIEDGHFARRADTQPPAAETFTVSVIATDPLRRRLLPGLEALALALSAWIEEEPLRTIGLQDLLSVRGIPAFLGGTRDLGVTLHRLDRLVAAEIARSGGSPATAALRRQLAASGQELTSTVLAAAAGSRYDEGRFDGFAGLALWLPRSADELALRLGDMGSAPTFGDAGGPTAWRRWIERLYAPPADL